MDKHTQSTFKFSSDVVSDTKGCLFFLAQFLTAFKIPVPAFNIYKPAAQTGVGKKSNQHACQLLGGSKFSASLKVNFRVLFVLKL